MAMMIVKFQCDDGEIFRRPLQKEPSFDAVVEVIASCRPEVKADAYSEGFLKYVDDEGDLCTLTPTTFADFLDLQKRINGKVLKLKLTVPKSFKPAASRETDAALDLQSGDRTATPAPSTATVDTAQPQASMPDQKEDPFPWLWKGKAKGKGKKGKHMKGHNQSAILESQTEESADGSPPNNQCQGPFASSTKQETCGNAAGPGVCSHRGGAWRLLCTLRVLLEVGLLTPSVFASLAVHWLPFLIKRAAAKVGVRITMNSGGSERVRELLEYHFTSEALSANTGERHLGEALLELLQALNGLDVEVQTQFCESLASALLPCLEDEQSLLSKYMFWFAISQTLRLSLEFLISFDSICMTFCLLSKEWLTGMSPEGRARLAEHLVVEGELPEWSWSLGLGQRSYFLRSRDCPDECCANAVLLQTLALRGDSCALCKLFRHLALSILPKCSDLPRRQSVVEFTYHPRPMMSCVPQPYEEVGLLTPSVFASLAVQTQFCESLASALLPCLEDEQSLLSKYIQEPHGLWKTWKGKGCGKGKKGKHMWKGCHFPDPSSQAEPGAAEEPEAPDSSQAEDIFSLLSPSSWCGPPSWGSMETAEVGLLTPSLFASLTVHWLPFLIKRAAAKVDKINRMAAEGLDPTLEKMLKIIQDPGGMEQAGATPGLEQHSTALAQALSANTGERHLGEALLELLQALNGLDVEVQTQFCESLASALLPCLDTCPDGFRPGVWGVGHHRCAPWRLLCTLNVLPEVGLLTPALFATLAEHWLPFLINGAAAKVDEINQLARDGLDAAIEKALKLIQEQAAATPGLEQSSTALAEALGAGRGERSLGEALLELLLALNGLHFEVKTQFCQSLVSALLPCLEDLNLWSKGSKGKGGGKGKCGKGKHMWKGCDFHAQSPAEEPSALTATEQPEGPNLTVEAEEGTTTCQPEKPAEPATAAPTNEPDVPSPNVEAEDTWSNGVGEWWAGFHGGHGSHGGHGGHGPRKLLSTLSTLRDVGLLTPAMFASLVVHWLPFLTHFVEQKVDKINRMGAEGLDPTIQKMLEIIQEQAAATPGLEQHCALIAEALSGDNGQRRLGEAALEMLRTLSALEVEVQTRFCESVASALLPCLEDLQTQPTWPTWQTWPTWPAWPMWKGKGKGKGKKGKQMWKGCHAHHAHHTHHAHHAHAGSQAAEPAPPAPSDDEFEKKVATLLELQIATEEVIRDLLMAHNDFKLRWCQQRTDENWAQPSAALGSSQSPGVFCPRRGRDGELTCCDEKHLLSFGLGMA
eukprot:s868_g7.t2